MTEPTLYFSGDSSDNTEGANIGKLKTISDTFSHQMFALLDLSSDVIPKFERGPEGVFPAIPAIDKFKSLLTAEENEELARALRWTADEMGGYIEKRNREGVAGEGKTQSSLPISSHNV
jgi:hypothetical protein